MKKAAALLRLMRPKQWIKNLFLFAAALFSYNIFKPDYLLHATLGFVVFCLVSSATYVYNDIIDRERDAYHPEKKNRPVASGTVRVHQAWILAAFLFAAAAAGAWLLNFWFFVIVMLYVLNSILYTHFVKRIVILDVISIAVNFIIRVVAGALVIQVFVSSWIILCTLQLALFIGFAKRRSEIILLSEGAGEHRESLKKYTTEFIDHMLSVVTSTAVMSYSLYTILDKKDHPAMMFTTIFVLYAIFRFQYLIYTKKRTEAPEEIVLSDWPLLIDAALWAITSAIILYKF
jgi:4-hydroxybenzoate polyprenyltransferase